MNFAIPGIQFQELIPACDIKVQEKSTMIIFKAIESKKCERCLNFKDWSQCSAIEMSLHDTVHGGCGRKREVKPSQGCSHQF